MGRFIQWLKGVIEQRFFFDQLSYQNFFRYQNDSLSSSILA
jgi:hypothetical protein